ncbi:MAG TPA: M1 family metallopeptidase [Saprospiraceae bacterium]|nr:M1 family metallopeptidase [Saprospiraceae bacterium]
MKHFAALSLLLMYSVGGISQNHRNNPQSNHGNKFEQLGTILPDANTYRTASGAPGHEYWQMRADYHIKARLDEPNTILYGSEWITYFNNSPDPLDYLWLQLDENEHDPKVPSNYASGESKLNDKVTQGDLESLDNRPKLAGHGVQIEAVEDEQGKKLHYTVNQTMMRVDLPKSLMPGKKIRFYVRWHYQIPDRMSVGGRGGLEYFKEDGNHLFTMSQWFPRMCVYSDFQGWQNKQFTGRAEFALAFGNYTVELTVPADHVIAATGQCQNYKEVLQPQQYARWENAQKSNEVVEIVTLEEARQAELSKSKQTRTWIYKAENVRDFAWGSSRKFIWDAMPVEVEGRKIMCMSYYAKEAYGLYRRYSTKTVAHTIRTYSKFTIPYSYPVAISVEASSGMEYPMICFNFGRTEKDGTYSEGTKQGMIGVIIHEVGHNFFPMIINSDERQWTWMDEGLNTFVQFLTEEAFDNDHPVGRGPANKIVDYMKLPKEQLEPIMTNSENLVHFGSNAYAKTAAGLNILRETILGRELFDYAFKEYSRRWAFRHPTPADFFRTMEDASGTDLDWFWRGWFYDIEPVDIALDSVHIRVAEGSLPMVKTDYYLQSDEPGETLTKYRNRQSGMSFLVDRDTSLRDFYYHHFAEKRKNTIRIDPKPAPAQLQGGGDSVYVCEIQFSNKGGLVMPIQLRWNYTDGSYSEEQLSVQIWRKNEKQVTKTFVKEKPIQSIQLDPYKETADIDISNNSWNIAEPPSRFEIFKSEKRENRRRRGDGSRPNIMQQQTAPR